MFFSTLVRQAIEKRGLSIRAAAREIGVAHTTLNRVIDGQDIDVGTIVKVCDWLGVPVSTALNTFSSKETLPEKLAVLIEAEPKLKEVFEQAMGDLENGSLSTNDLSDIVSYAAYKINLKREVSNVESQGKGG